MKNVAGRYRRSRRCSNRGMAWTPNSPRESGPGDLSPRAIQSDMASKSKVRQTVPPMLTASYRMGRCDPGSVATRIARSVRPRRRSSSPRRTSASLLTGRSRSTHRPWSRSHRSRPSIPTGRRYRPGGTQPDLTGSPPTGHARLRGFEVVRDLRPRRQPDAVVPADVLQGCVQGADPVGDPDQVGVERDRHHPSRVLALAVEDVELAADHLLELAG